MAVPRTEPATYLSAILLTTLSTFCCNDSTARASKPRGVNVSSSLPELKTSFPLIMYRDWRPATPRTAGPWVVILNCTRYNALRCPPKMEANRTNRPSISRRRVSMSSSFLPEMGASLASLSSTSPKGASSCGARMPWTSRLLSARG